MKEVAEMAVKLMAASARTAPKAGGKDFLEIVVITKEEDLKKIAEAMKAYAPKSTNEALLAEGCIEHREFPGASSGGSEQTCDSRAMTAAGAAIRPARNLQRTNR